MKQHLMHSGTNWQTTMPERYNYWLYFTGQTFSVTLTGSFVTTFLLMQGINVTIAGLAMILLSVLDIFNDMIFGIIFDKIHFKNRNKNLPWLRWGILILPLATLFIFAIPQQLSTNVKLFWFILSYLLWLIIDTIIDVPLYNLATAMTDLIIERNTLLSIGRAFALMGNIGATLFMSILISERIGMSFANATLVICLLAMMLMIPLNFTSKERVKVNQNHESYTFGEMWHYLKLNRNLRSFYLGYVIFGILTTEPAVDLFVSYYLFGSALFSTFMLLITSVPILITGLLIKQLLKRFDKFWLFYLANVLYILLGIVIYFGGYRKIWFYVLINVIRSVPTAIIYILNLTFTPDCVEYGEYKTGIDARGVAFAIQSFCTKVIALAQPIAIFLLSLFGWRSMQANSFAQIKTMHIVQSASALNGLWITAILIPIIGTALALIPLSFYQLNDRDVQIMSQYNHGMISRTEAESRLKHHE